MIELVIKIDEELYNDMKSLPFTTFAEDIIMNGTPLQEHLNKIKSEIEALSNANPSYTHTCDVVDREDVIDIIDKYIEGSDSE